MRMRKRVALKIWSPGTISYDAEGNQTYTWTATSSTGDFQPVGNRQSTVETFGIDTIQPESRILFADDAAFSSVGYGYKIENMDGVTSPSRGPIYEVVGIAPWYLHHELLLQPFKGAAPT